MVEFCINFLVYFLSLPVYLQGKQINRGRHSRHALHCTEAPETLRDLHQDALHRLQLSLQHHHP